VLLWCTSAFAENFVAVKYGHVKYVKEAISEWEWDGSHIYYPADAFGIAIGREKNGWITRLDVSKERTGVEFQHALGIAYDGCKINTYPVTLQFGKKINTWLPVYLLAGGGVVINDAEFWQYDPYPFNGKMYNSWCAVATLGVEKNLTKHIYVFAEARYLYSKARVKVEGYSSFKEDLSSNSIWAGLGYKW